MGLGLPGFDGLSAEVDVVVTSSWVVLIGLLVLVLIVLEAALEKDP